MKSINAWRAWRRVVSVLITMITIGAFLTGCDTEEKSIGSSRVEAERPVERFEFESGEQLEQLINSLNYTPEAWQDGIREVPRLYITNIPKRWRDKTSKEIPVVTKKRVFFRLMGPLILHANELIQADRQQLESIIKTIKSGKTPSPSEQSFLKESAVAYKVAEKEEDVDITDRGLQDELLRRVDTLPPSLVLAQTAEESGWGTSRFAVEGNALFGMWTWSDKGITPKEQRSEHGDHKIASYETPLQSVIAYMRNINTHPSYKSLRAGRAEMRRAGTKIAGWELAKTLTKYSERGQEYVDSLHALMKTNMLMETDDAYLGDGPTILLIPVGEGT
ncbi:glucosaminidase domain-containing protein [Desulfopila sp. IMCC35008]|uniref:glucosaminidase domain-containing protein n=1 Tax=Desulfopila sp. IMCC35008 TaxID=2653858 RepID=UPI0013D36E4B|nr:glucosaminidase domain-containing protein [Desulfopila sp. IMCC35008]